MQSAIVHAVNQTVAEMHEWAQWTYERTPFADVVVRYIRSSYQNDPVRIVLELLLALFAIQYLRSRTYSPDSKGQRVKLTEREIDELVAEWEPEPLAPISAGGVQGDDLRELQVIQGPSGPHVTLSGSDTQQE